MSTAMQSYAADQPFAPRWSANSLVRVKATGEQTEGRLSVLEPVIPAGFASPWHVHHTEDELIYVIRGQLTVMVGERRLTPGPGGCAFGPRDVPHAFRVEGEQPAHLLLVTTSGDHASFIIEASEPAAAPTLPEPREPDFARLGDLARRHGQEILVHSRDDPQPVLYERRLTLAHD